jgi:hypothetical protein
LRLVQQTLEERGLSSLLEGSRRGGHLWLFFSLPQPAPLATSVVQGVLDPLYDSRHLPNVLEVYPDHTELGHAVRMPLGIHRRTGLRYPFLDQRGSQIDLEDLPGAMAFALAPPVIRPEQLRAVAATLGVVGQSSRTWPGASSGTSLRLPSSTTSAVIRWVDAQVNLLDLLEELAPSTDMRLAGQGYLGWRPFHDDLAPDANGDPGTPSFYVVYNRRYGWSWRCLSSNCATPTDRCATVSASSRSFSNWMSSVRSALPSSAGPTSYGKERNE